MKGMKCALNSTIVSIGLNLLLPFVVVKLLKLSGGPSVVGKMINMLHHHYETPLTSSIIVALIVYLSVVIGYSLQLL